jgi:hypothetical protein
MKHLRTKAFLSFVVECSMSFLWRPGGMARDAPNARARALSPYRNSPGSGPCRRPSCRWWLSVRSWNCSTTVCPTHMLVKDQNMLSRHIEVERLFRRLISRRCIAQAATNSELNRLPLPYHSSAPKSISSSVKGGNGPRRCLLSAAKKRLFRLAISDGRMVMSVVV